MLKPYIDARVVKVLSPSFGPAPVLLSQKAYADFIRLAPRAEILSHEFEFTELTPNLLGLNFYGSLDLNQGRGTNAYPSMDN